MIVYIDMDDVLCDYTNAFNKALELTPNIAFPQSQYGFYANLSPMSGAIESVNKLLNIEQLDVSILMAPSIRNLLSYAEKRVQIERYFSFEFIEKLIISPNKGLLKGDILIDDLIEGRGQENFEGKLIQFGSLQYKNWNSVLDYFDDIIEK